MKHQLDFEIDFERKAALWGLCDSIGPTIYDWSKERLEDSNYTNDKRLNDLQLGILFLETYYYATADIVYKLDGSFTSEERDFLLYTLAVNAIASDDEDEETVNELIDRGNLLTRLKQYRGKNQYKTFKSILSGQPSLPFNKLESYGYAMRVHAHIGVLEASING